MRGIDENIISELRDGSHEAFEMVFAAWFGRVKAFIFGYVKSEADAEELAEDVFVGLWVNHASLDPSKSFSSYLHTVARNTALNFLRHKFVRYGGPATATMSAAEKAEKVEKTEEAEEAAGGSFENELIARETALLIEMAVEKMPAQRKEVYRLSRSEGLKNDEIADRLGTTKHNVESQLSHALKDIKRVILTAFMLIP
jgi:RNA polymerase sigma-70 factor (ECF subfamily)